MLKNKKLNNIQGGSMSEFLLSRDNLRYPKIYIKTKKKNAHVTLNVS